MNYKRFLEIAKQLELAGIYWKPEIGDEVCSKDDPSNIFILVNTTSLTPTEIKEKYLWLPTVEQMMLQIEVRSAILKHAGLSANRTDLSYKTVIISQETGEIESSAASLRSALGMSLRELIQKKYSVLH